jgi:hypothetical protein
MAANSSQARRARLPSCSGVEGKAAAGRCSIAHLCMISHKAQFGHANIRTLCVCETNCQFWNTQ